MKTYPRYVFVDLYPTISSACGKCQKTLATYFVQLYTAVLNWHHCILSKPSLVYNNEDMSSCLLSFIEQNEYFKRVTT